MNTTTPRKALLGGILALLGASALAQEAVIRKNLPERLPQLKSIDEVNKTGIPGLFEIRVNGSDIFYTDSQANYLIMGNLIDTQAKRNLTEERLEKLSAVKFDELPLKDAFTIVRGTGKRKLAVFEDPNCGYCKRFERDLQKLDNVTVYMFLYPILGPESGEKSKAIWCAKEPAKVWQDWMLRDKQPPSPTNGCDSTALARNIELGRNYRINGTPTIILSNGQRIPGAVDDKQLEKALAEVKG